MIAGMVLIARDATTDVHAVGHGPDASNLSPVEVRTVPAVDGTPVTAATAD